MLIQQALCVRARPRCLFDMEEGRAEEGPSQLISMISTALTQNQVW